MMQKTVPNMLCWQRKIHNHGPVGKPALRDIPALFGTGFCCIDQAGLELPMELKTDITLAIFQCQSPVCCNNRPVALCLAGYFYFFQFHILCVLEMKARACTVGIRIWMWNVQYLPQDHKLKVWSPDLVTVMFWNIYKKTSRRQAWVPQPSLFVEGFDLQPGPGSNPSLSASQSQPCEEALL